MKQINAITFAPFAPRGSFLLSAARESLSQMRTRTGASHVILAPAGLQDTPQSEEIYFDGEGTLSDEELTAMIQYAQSLGLDVILKPTVNCKNGGWRAHINFFDNDVPCEPKWGNWFAYHEKFQLHFAALAERTGCVMFITGCEMVQAQRREMEWRDLIAKVKQVYSGSVSYNTDKYQEENVSWWDCVDVISSSGYYPFGSWETQLDRIEAVVKRYEKPFFFAETGCMSTSGSGRAPNDWGLQGELDLTEQAQWYREMYIHTKRRPWVGGYGLWDWADSLPSPSEARQDRGYHLYDKPAEDVVRKYYVGK